MHQGVREKLAELVCYREGINAHLTAAIEMAEPSPGGLLMPNQALLYAGRVFASTQLPAMMHLARDLCGGQLCVTPSTALFDGPGARWLQKYFAIGEIPAEDRRRLFAFARDLLNSDYAGHRLTFQLFAQSPPFAHLLAVYNNYDFGGPLDLVADTPTSRTRSANEGRRREPITAGGHLRIRPFNTADSYPEQRLENDLCQAVVAGNTIYLRGQVPQDLDCGGNVQIGDPAGQAERVMTNIETLLAEAGATVDHVVCCNVYLTDIRHREPVYRVLDGGSKASTRCSPAWWCPRSPGRSGSWR